MSTRPAELPELTIRAILLGGLITLLFTAANVYLGLKVGLTFATSIPAAVISMAVLRYFSTSNILENNIVQTVASAAGTLAAIIFVLPGLVMIGWWQGFPFWTTAAVCALGGILGVMFSVPLRRALVSGSPLPYPEGVAAAEVLKIGAESRAGAAEAGKGLRVIVVNALAAAGFAVLAAMRLVTGEAAAFFRIGSSATGISGGLSFALVGAGHLVGLSVGFAMFVGLALGWWVALPILTAAVPFTGTTEEFALSVFRGQVRFLGAGVIGVAAIWTLLKIIGPIIGGVRSALAASRARNSSAEALPLTERDIPIGMVGGIILATLLPIAWLLWTFIAGGVLESHAVPLILGTLVYVLIAGVVIASVCGYMAGLIGASNSPISGIGILAILAAALLLVAGFGRGGDSGETQALIAYALFATAIVFGIATISNDNLQDLKTGQLVGATPWRQQVALVFGVIFGSLVIPPVLGLLYTAFGFAGMPGAGPQALAAPQAALISALANGVLGGDLDWQMIGIGAAVGVVVVAIDEALGRAGKLRMPPLGVGIGIYLPMAVTLPVVIGAVLGWFYDKRADRMADPETAKRMGVLMATGLIVGESLFGVAFAGIVAGSGSDSPLAVVGPGFAPVALIGGTLFFIALTAWLYRTTAKAAS
ncbi:OPT family oligopeptide transporter [Sphingobium boeckii]|uniref:Putative OPT family oligopeptide transporter n=1 Tax=Sphingobium boeckii TaxID=1082345 RepID=A0A7W9AF81_9SPHN|nr:oligopeptide transporter, OPT family [Sphingobium boeckii]MBB5684510.1 putative OPT family oligopeptide transporter [Sphingobium boeckii]